MPIVHQDHGFDFTIKAEDKDPPKVHVSGAARSICWSGSGCPRSVTRTSIDDDHTMKQANHQMVANQRTSNQIA